MVAVGPVCTGMVFHEILYGDEEPVMVNVADPLVVQFALLTRGVIF